MFRIDEAYRTGRSCLPYGKQARGAWSGHLGEVAFCFGLACFCLPAKTGGGRVERFKSVKYNFSVRPSSLHKLSAGVQQIYNTAQEVNGLAQKNKVSIEGLASEVGSFRFNGEGG